MKKAICSFLFFFSVITLHAGFVFKTPPSNFLFQEENVICLISCQGKQLVLLKSPFVQGGNLWTLPKTILQKNESAHLAAHRLIGKELGIDFSIADLIYKEKVYFMYPTRHVTTHIFRISLRNLPDRVRLPHQEFSQYRFAASKEMDGMHFLPGEKECLELFSRKK